MNLQRLEWIGVALPVAFLVLYHYLLEGPAHGLLHSLSGIAFLIASLGVVVAAFSRAMFRAIGQRQSDLARLSVIVSRQNSQLRALNEANLALSEETLVSAVLQRVVDLARELGQARYAALSVLGEDGTLSAFLTSGITPKRGRR